MIRFVDLTCSYWVEDPSESGYELGSPMCGFICMINSKFIESKDGKHIFESLEEIRESYPDDGDAVKPMLGRSITAERLIRLLPEGFLPEKYNTSLEST